MKFSAKTQALYDLIAPAVSACQVDLWGIEFLQQGKRSLLRIYIDKPESSHHNDIIAPEDTDAAASVTAPEDGDDEQD
ncbi:MAG: hypothetical protein EOO68_29870, partial [Moraxellaceae bacterium]